MVCLIAAGDGGGGGGVMLLLVSLPDWRLHKLFDNMAPNDLK